MDQGMFKELTLDGDKQDSLIKVRFFCVLQLTPLVYSGYKHYSILITFFINNGFMMIIS